MKLTYALKSFAFALLSKCLFRLHVLETFLIQYRSEHTLKMRRARYGISKSVNTDIQFSFELSLLFIHMLNKYLPEVAGDRFFIYNSL